MRSACFRRSDHRWYLSVYREERCKHSRTPNSQLLGNLYRFNHDLSRHDVRPSLTIPNGLGWSLDQKTMYFTHSTEKRIIAFNYTSTTGDISNERVFWQYDGPGDPDGFKMDTDGYIWQAIYGDSKVLKISPEGKVVGEIRYPAKCITCPVFIGTELWVTTAKEDDEKSESAEFGGALFKVDVGIGGVKETKFKSDRSIDA
jgi:sugar lactone lactonase YvrE